MSFDILRVTFLAFIQGLTEFLPISSSAHLILPSQIFGWEDQGLAFDVAVHLGTLLAVILYFRKDIVTIFLAWCKSLSGKGNDDNSRLGWMIIAATMPAIIAGFILKDFIDEQLRSSVVIAGSTIFFGVLLYYSDFKSSKTLALKDISWKAGLIIGFAQALALIPGTSRSGITMTAALMCNLNRESAARFSFLLSVPVIAGAAFLLILDLLKINQVNWLELSYAMLVAAIVAYACIHYFLRLINGLGFLPFVIYRVLLGLMLFMFFI